MMTFFTAYTLVFEWLIAVSLISFIMSLIVIPWLIIQMPYDYFSFKKRQKWKWSHSSVILNFIKDLLGLILIIAGTLMLVLPGQGILTILVGVILANFPGKYKLERWIIHRPSVLKTLNWLRKRAKKRPLLVND